MSRHCDVTGLPPSTCPCGACWDDEDEAQDGSGEAAGAAAAVREDRDAFAAECDRLREQLAIAMTALRELRDGIPASDFGHDIAHAALDGIGGVTP